MTRPIGDLPRVHIASYVLDVALTIAANLPAHPPSHSALGAAYGTAKSGTGIAQMAVMHPERE